MITNPGYITCFGAIKIDLKARVCSILLAASSLFLQPHKASCSTSLKHLASYSQTHPIRSEPK